MSSQQAIKNLTEFQHESKHTGFISHHNQIHKRTIVKHDIAMSFLFAFDLAPPLA